MTRLLRDFSVIAVVAGLFAVAPGAGPLAAEGPAGLDAVSAAKAIDGLIAAEHERANIEPTVVSLDAEFVRRVFLDLIGRIPTQHEAESFLADPSPKKRIALVDRLLASPEYGEYWGGVYADLFLGREHRIKRRRSETWLEYFEDSLTQNLAYDRMVVEMLTAEGPVAQNGATGFIAARAQKGGSIEQVAGATANLFLGVQIQCAQCHDHPYVARFKQQDFAKFAAFYGQTGGRRVNGVATVSRKNIPMRAAQGPKFKKRLAKNPALIYAVTEPSFFGLNVPRQAGETRRQWLARAILSTDEFSQVTVNRLWDRLFGNGIVRPIDDLGYIGKADRPPLLTELAARFRQSGYDHKALLKAIVLSDAYQRTSSGPVPAGANLDTLEKSFARAAVRQLSADQLFNSIVTATDLASAANARLRRRTVEKARYRNLREFLVLFDNDEGGSSVGFSGNVPQGLLLLNGQLTNIGARGAKGTTLARALASSKDKQARIDALFLATYSRRPTIAEHSRLSKIPNSPVALKDLFHALLTSTEFTTNH